MSKMKRIGVVGLCLLVIVVSAGMAASSAYAGEYGRCVKEVGGPYEDANCTKEVAVGGEFKWVPGPGPKPQYKSKSKAASITAEIENPATGVLEAKTVTCKASKDSGKITGVKTDTDTITFTGCAFEAKKCASPGKKAGEIETVALQTTLIDHGETGPFGVGEPAVGEVWTLFNAPLFGDITEFTCGAFEITVKDWVAGVTTPTNEMKKVFTTVFEAGKGIQHLVVEIKGVGTAVGVLKVTTTTKTKEAIEIKT